MPVQDDETHESAFSLSGPPNSTYTEKSEDN